MPNGPFSNAIADALHRAKPTLELMATADASLDWDIHLAQWRVDLQAVSDALRQVSAQGFDRNEFLERCYDGRTREHATTKPKADMQHDHPSRPDDPWRETPR